MRRRRWCAINLTPWQHTEAQQPYTRGVTASSRLWDQEGNRLGGRYYQRQTYLNPQWSVRSRAGVEKNWFEAACTSLRPSLSSSCTLSSAGGG